MAVLFVHTDGGSRGNPGPSACGTVFLDELGNVLFEEKFFLGNGTNNEAEYRGLLLALEHLPAFLKENPVSKVVFRLDSNLVVQQIQGNWKVKDARMAQYVIQARKAAQTLQTPWSIEYVPRAQNSLADLLVNQSLDAAQL